MNEITIAVKFDNDKPTVSGQELHAALMIETPYHKWFPRMCEYGFVEGRDFNLDKNVRVQSEGKRNVSREVIDHRITVDMAKELCMIQRTEGRASKDRTLRSAYQGTERRCDRRAHCAQKQQLKSGHSAENRELRSHSLALCLVLRYNDRVNRLS